MHTMRHSAFIALCVCFSMHTGTVAQPAPVYSIHESEPATGTSIRREIFRSPIAVNHTYQQLSIEDRKKLLDYFEKVEPGDEPPFPQLGLRPVLLGIYERPRRVNTTGPLLMIVEVNSQGEATGVQVMQYPSPEIGRYAAAALMLEKYKPALCAGKACKGSFPLSVELTLK